MVITTLRSSFTNFWCSRDEAARQIKGSAAVAAFHNEIDQIPDPKKKLDEAKHQGLELFENNSAILLKRGYSLRKQKNPIAARRPPGPTPNSAVQSRPAEPSRAVQQGRDFSVDHRPADRDRSHQAQPRVKEQPVQQLYQVSQFDVVVGRSRLNSLQLRTGAPASRSDIDRGQSRLVQSKKELTVSGAFGVALKPAVSREDSSVDSPFKSEGSSAVPEKPTAESSIDNRRLSNGSKSEGGFYSDNSDIHYKIELNEEAARLKEKKEAKAAKERALSQRTVSRKIVRESGGSKVVDNRERVLPNESQRGIGRGLFPHNSPSLKNNVTSVHQLAQRFRSEEENSDQVCSQRENERAVEGKLTWCTVEERATGSHWYCQETISKTRTRHAPSPPVLFTTLVFHAYPTTRLSHIASAASLSGLGGGHSFRIFYLGCVFMFRIFFHTFLHHVHIFRNAVCSGENLLLTMVVSYRGTSFRKVARHTREFLRTQKFHLRVKLLPNLSAWTQAISRIRTRAEPVASVQVPYQAVCSIPRDRIPPVADLTTLRQPQDPRFQGFVCR